MAELTRKEVVLILAGVSETARPRRGEHLLRLAGVDLSGLNLRGLNFAHADLAGADLRGCDLRDARLFEADLSSSDLRDANLRGVYADGATFVDACLQAADFRPSERDLFYGTHLRGADFTGADLTDGNLESAHLWDARFQGAKLLRTRFARARMNARTHFTGSEQVECSLSEVDWADNRTLTMIPPGAASDEADSPNVPVPARAGVGRQVRLEIRRTLTHPEAA